MAISFETFHAAHQRIFGKKPTRRSSSDGINQHQKTIIEGNGVVHITNVSKKKTPAKTAKKEICPHCATKNLIRVDTWTVKCEKCGYER